MRFWILVSATNEVHIETDWKIEPKTWNLPQMNARMNSIYLNIKNWANINPMCGWLKKLVHQPLKGQNTENLSSSSWGFNVLTQSYNKYCSLLTFDQIKIAIVEYALRHFIFCTH